MQKHSIDASPFPYPIHHFHRLEHREKLPEALWMIRRAPISLYIQGTQSALKLLEYLPERGFAVVGTRRPQNRSLQLLKARIPWFRGRGIIVISGLAHGVDAAAHEEALRAGVPTIAILGGPLQEIYPPSNSDLARQILDAGGLLVSEMGPNQKLAPYSFIMRNRIIAGWARATWVVEAGFRSGALNTAAWAREMEKTCLATPCFPGDPSFAGTEKLLEGGKAVGFYGPGDLAQAWIEYATFSPEKEVQRKAPKETLSFDFDPPSTDADELAHEVEKQTYQRGGLQTEDLLEWGFAKEWTPQRLFTALQSALSHGFLEDRNGVLTRSRSPGLIKLNNSD